MVSPSEPLLMLSSAQKRCFIAQGYIVLRNAVPAALVERAHQFITAAYAAKRYEQRGSTLPTYRHALPVFDGDVKSDSAVTELMFGSSLVHAVENLLGAGNALVRWNSGQVAYTPTLQVDGGEGLTRKVTWHVDSGGGKTACVGSAFMCLVGVAVSPGQEVDEARGQFLVWPGSHLITHRTMSDIIGTTRTEHVMETFRAQSHSLALGAPRRLLLHQGDAFIAHQRLAHAAGANDWTKPRVNVYFRILHRQQDHLLDRYIRSSRPFTGFTGLATELPMEDSDDVGDAVGDDVGIGDGAGAGSTTTCSQIIRPYSAVGVTSALPQDSWLRQALMLTEKQRDMFRRDGYFIVRGIVPPHVVADARKCIEGLHHEGKFMRTGPDVRSGMLGESAQLHKTVQRRREIVDAFYQSGIVDVCESLVGRGRVLIIPNIAKVIYCPPETVTDAGDRDHGNAGRAAEGTDAWDVRPSVENFDVPEEDCALHAYVPLTDFAGVNTSDTSGELQGEHGQLLLWPGTHFKVQRAFADIAQQGIAQQDKECGEMRRKWKQRLPDISEQRPSAPVVNTGDFVIYHCRLPAAIARNRSNAAAVAVKFRVVHTESERLLHDKNTSHSPFVGLHV